MLERGSITTENTPPVDFNEATYLALNKDVAHAVRVGAFKSGADHWLRCGRHESRKMRAAAHRPAAPQSDIKWIGAGVGEGQTRKCLDPWSYIQVKATGQVQPCCAHPPIGTLSDEVDLKAVMSGRSLEALRLGLLVGQLNTYCGRCSIKSPVALETLRHEWARHQIEWNKLPRDDNGNLVLDGNDAIPGWIRFKNVERGRFAIKESITLYSRDQLPEPTIIFENLDWTQSPLIDFFVTVPPSSGCIDVWLSVGEHADNMHVKRKSTVFRGEVLNIVEELPTAYLRGSISISAMKHFPNDNTQNSVASLTLPVLRNRVAGT